MSIFLTGSTGYLGSYVVKEILRNSKQNLNLLVRAETEEKAWARLWKSLQLHMDFEEFRELTRNRVNLYLGDLTGLSFGLKGKTYERLTENTSSILHVAASLNRKSNKACFNVNLRGTLEIIKLARASHTSHGLERISEVSTSAVAGVRQGESVFEDEAIDWNRSDYDPYARTKKFSEHMLEELLPDVPKTIFRPSTVMGDENHEKTTQFDMVRAFVALADLRIIPLESDWRMDIVPASFVGEAIARIHLSPSPRHLIYNLSSGSESPTFQEIVDRLQESGVAKSSLFVPQLLRPFKLLVAAMEKSPRKFGVSRLGAMMRVFLPYLTYNTVFPNERAVEEMGRKPKKFLEYAPELYRFAKGCNFSYPYQSWPEERKESKVA